MIWQRRAFFLAIIAAVSFSGYVLAQAPVTGNPRPLSNPGGYAGTELRSIYRQGIGQGYSVESLNQLALRNARANVPILGQVSTRERPASFGIGTSPSVGKPFTGFSPEPTVSPYLNLFRDDFSGESDLNYQTLVRPQLQQQQFNQQIQRQSMEIARRLQAISAQTNFNPQGSTTQPPTGHPSAFMYYGRHYPQMMQRRR